MVSRAVPSAAVWVTASRIVPRSTRTRSVSAGHTRIRWRTRAAMEEIGDALGEGDQEIAATVLRAMRDWDAFFLNSLAFISWCRRSAGDILLLPWSVWAHAGLTVSWGCCGGPHRSLHPGRLMSKMYEAQDVQELLEVSVAFFVPGGCLTSWRGEHSAGTNASCC